MYPQLNDDICADFGMVETCIQGFDDTLDADYLFMNLTADKNVLKKYTIMTFTAGRHFVVLVPRTMTGD